MNLAHFKLHTTLLVQKIILMFSDNHSDDNESTAKNTKPLTLTSAHDASAKV